jgi:hypothetical protein
VLRYAVADRYGKSGEGLIRLGVVQPGAPQPPVAMPDDVTAAPGRQVTVDVLANDLVPRNADVVVEDPATTNSPEVLAQFTGRASSPSRWPRPRRARRRSSSTASTAACSIRRARR